MTTSPAEGTRGVGIVDLPPDGTIASAEQADLANAITASLVTSHPNQSGGGAWLPESESEYITYERQLRAIKLSAETKEGQDSRAAVQNSLEKDKELAEATHNTEWASLSDPGRPAPSGNKSRRNSHLADMIEDMALRLATEMHMLNDPKGDTYVFIDPPAQQPEQDSCSYQRYRERYTNPLCMKKERFMTLDSPFFETAFGPSAQFRTLRRRGLVGRLPDTIKYVLDLTPPTEGEDAVYLTTELCCSEGVRKWYQAGQRWNVSRMLVGGQEEYVAPFRVRKNSSQNVDDQNTSGGVLMGAESAAPPPTPEKLRLTQVTGEQQVNDSHPPIVKIKSDPKDIPIPLEYSPVRHRSAIERVLHAAVEGLDPQIDSAPKLWTTFAVAKYYEIRRSPLTDYIVRWLRATPNSYFLEALPEISLKIADGLECYELCRDTFAILVGEEALANVCRGRVTEGLVTGGSVHGRKRDDLPEIYQTRVEYASKAFLERIMAEFMSLVDGRMSWLDDVPEFRKLSAPGLSHITDRPEFSELVSNLKAYLRGHIYWILCDAGSNPSGPLADFALDRTIEGEGLFPTTKFSHTWRQLLPRERIFTRSFWKLLSQSQCNRQASNLCGSSGWSVPKKYWSETAKAYQDAGIFVEVSKGSLEVLVRECNMIYRKYSPVVTTQEVQAASAPSNFNFKFRPGYRGLGQGRSPMQEQAQVSLPIRTQQPIAHAQLERERQRILSKREDSFGVSTGVQGNYSYHRCWAHQRLYHNSMLTYAVAVPFAPTRIANAPAVATNGPPRTTDFPGWIRTSYDLDLYQDSSQAQGSNASDTTLRYESFHLIEFFHQAHEYIGRICHRMLALPDASMRAETLELMLTDTLVCLEDAEWKYLPLWAGGNDDGSGGVFDDGVPLANAGFSTAGPGVHTGIGSSAASSEFEVISSQTDGSTRHTSAVVNDGFSDTMDRRRVYDADSLWSDITANRDHDNQSARSKVADTATMQESEAGWDDFMTDMGGGETSKVKTEDKGKAKMADDEEDDEEMFDDVFTQEVDDDDDEEEEEEDDDGDDGNDFYSVDGNDDDDSDDDNMVMV